MKILLATTILVILIPLALAACSSSEDAGESLVGPVWILTDLAGELPLPGTTVFMAFSEDGNVNGSDGCNNFGRTYEVDGNKISFSEMGPTTLMACPEPINAQATAFQEALGNTAQFSVSGDELVLKDADGVTLATFQVQDQSLEGTSWTVSRYNNGTGGFSSVIIDTEITANFGEDGNVTGSDGCNNYNRPYETDGNTIKFGETFANTMMACPDQIEAQAAAYQQALGNAATYEIIGDTLTLFDADGTRMVAFVQ
jgi:heat shock protein HslJ